MNYTFNRRYKKELEFLSEYYKNIKINKENTDKEVRITLILGNYTIFIILNNDYPFSPPQDIKINNLDINCYVNLNVSLLLKKYFDIFCIKCESLLCENKWNPTYKLTNIISEQIKYYNYINSIINITEIQKKVYINEDIIINIMNYIKDK